MDKTETQSAAGSTRLLVCPGCGCETPTLNEGYCEVCRVQNQNALDEHNAAYDRWRKLSEAERIAEIRRAY